MVELGERWGFFRGGWDGVGGGRMQLPLGAHRDPLPLTLPQPLSSVSTPLFPVHVPSPQASVPLFLRYWPVAKTTAPEKERRKGSK